MSDVEVSDESGDEEEKKDVCDIFLAAPTVRFLQDEDVEKAKQKAEKKGEEVDPSIQPGKLELTRKRVGATELFFDLVFVTAVARMGENLRADLPFMEYCQYFFAVWFFWMANTVYSSLFAADDLLNKTFYGLYGIGIVAVSMHATGGWESSNATNFGYAAAFMRYLVGFMYLRTVWYLYNARKDLNISDESVKKNSKKGLRKILILCLRELAVGTLWILGASFSGRNVRGGLFWFATLFDPILYLSLLGCMGTHGVLIPNAEHFTERVEGFVIIVLGETVNGVTINYEGVTDRHGLYTACTLGFLMVFFIKLFHFDVEVYDPEEEGHALNNKNHIYSLLWEVLHGFESLGIAMIGAGVAELCLQAGKVHSDQVLDADKKRNRAITITCLGLAFTMIGHALIQLTHVPDYEDFPGAKILYWFQLAFESVCGVVLVVLIPIFQDSSIAPTEILAIMTIGAFVVVVVNLLDECTDAIYETKRKFKEGEYLSPRPQEDVELEKKSLLTDGKDRYDGGGKP